MNKSVNQNRKNLYIVYLCGFMFWYRIVKNEQNRKRMSEKLFMYIAVC